MNRIAIASACFILVWASPASRPVTAAPPGFEFEESDQGVLVREGGREVLFYQRAPKSIDGRYSRAHYVHPLYGLDGEVLSEDFPADHLHHRGIFWAWHQVWVGATRAGDPWVCEDFEWDVRSVEPRNCEDGAAELRIGVHWKSPRVTDASGAVRPMVDETAVIRIHPSTDDARAIDFCFRLRPLVSGVRIGGSEDEKGYGGFSPRIRLPDELRFVSTSGEVEPRTQQIEAGPWMDLVGRFGPGRDVRGIAILGHPTLPDHVQPWILRRSRSMQNAVWPGRHPAALPRDSALAFNYRLLLHRGDTEAADVAGHYEAYAAEPPRLSGNAN